MTKTHPLMEYVNRKWPCQAVPFGVSNELAQRFGISRQRVHQVLDAHGVARAKAALDKSHYLCSCGKPMTRVPVPEAERKRPFYCHHVVNLVALTCDHCGKVFQRKGSQVIANANDPKYASGKVFCSKQCFYLGGDPGQKGRPRPRRRASDTVRDEQEVRP